MNLRLFAIAVRHLNRQIGYSISAITGLSLALTIFYFAIGLVLHETYTDRNFKNIENLYRIRSSFNMSEDKTFDPNVPVQVGYALEQRIPEIEVVTPIHDIKSVVLIDYQGRTFKELNWVLTDQNFPSLFDPSTFSIKFPFKEGTILINETTAARIFGEEDPIGQILQTNHGKFLIVGLFKDFPSNSHLQIEAAAVPLSGIHRKNAYLYARLSARAKTGSLEQKLGVESKVLGSEFGPFTYTLEKIEAIYAAGVSGFVVKGIDRERMYLLIIMAAIILLISIFNVFHFTHVKCLYRGKEVGIKKVLGVQNPQLTLQFFVESSIIVAISFLLSIVISQSIKSQAFDYLRISEIDYSISFGMTGVLALIIALTLALLQSYVFYNITPNLAISGSHSEKARGTYVKLTVAIQFFISTLLISGASLVYKQLNYISNLPLGFKIDGLWFLNSENENIDLAIFKNAISDIPGIEIAALSTSIPTKGYKLFVFDDNGEQRKLFECTVDKDFFETYEIPFVAPPLDLFNNSLILTESAAVIHDEFLKEGHYVGVVKDFHSLKLVQPIMPIRFWIGDAKQGFLTVRVQNGKELEVRKSIEKRWTSLYPNEPMSLNNLRDHFISSHRTVHDVNEVLSALLIISIFISSVGLSSLVSFFVRKRYKELAIRKVLGATLKQVILHINVEFFVVIGCSSLISIPFFNYFGNLWLDNFSYHTHIEFLDYMLPIVCVLVIAFLVMVTRTWKSALANPVNALRSE